MKRINNKQKGFTIIELVVVILLLGILTATALPRFMDVTAEAHDAVLDGVESGFTTGLALFRAQWYAERQPTTTGIAEFGSLFANSGGYPIGPNSDLTDAGSTNGTECLTIYNTLLQSGRPPAAAIQWSATAATLETNIEAVATTNDFAISAASASPVTGCTLYYLGEGRTGTAANNLTIDTITYTFSGAVMTRGTVTLDQG